MAGKEQAKPTTVKIFRVGNAQDYLIIENNEAEIARHVGDGKVWTLDEKAAASAKPPKAEKPDTDKA